MALSRSDLTFSASYLAQGQAEPRQSLEACMRGLLPWIQQGENLRKMQAFPTPAPLRVSGPNEVVAYVDASEGSPSKRALESRTCRLCLRPERSCLP